MAKLHRARVVAVGKEKDMLRMARVMLQNGDWLDEDDFGPRETLESRLTEVVKRSRWEQGDGCQFLPVMLTPAPYGELIPERSKLRVMHHACGLWTATFTYDSWDAFQGEDWLHFHESCCRMPMFALHANEDFTRDKGRVVFSGGQMQEDWSCMAECWLWLQEQYYAGLSPEEACLRLRMLEKALRMEDWDQDVPTLLQSCVNLLLNVHTRCQQITITALQAAESARDYPKLFALQEDLANTMLWENEHIARWTACLESTLHQWGKEQGSC